MFQFFWWSRQSNAPISGPRLFLERLLGPSEGKTRVLKKTLEITGKWDTNCQESQNSADSSCWFRWCLITECMVPNMIVTFSEDSWNTAELSSSIVSISSTLSGELPLHWLNHPHPVTFQHLQDVSPWFLSRSPWQPSPHPTFLKIICLAQLAKITIANLVFLCFSARVWMVWNRRKHQSTVETGRAELQTTIHHTKILARLPPPDRQLAFTSIPCR